VSTEFVTPPGPLAATLNCSHLAETPGVYAGSFLLRERRDYFDADPPLITPVDELSGLPYVMVPPEYPLPANNYQLADDNHAWHPSRSPLLATPSGEALRNSRVQRVDWYDHHIVYHKYFYGPEIPTEEADIFRRIVFAVARYIPDLAIDCNGYEPVIQRLRPEEKERLWRSNELRVPRPGLVRGFLGNYVARQDISHVKDSRIDEFMNTSNEYRQAFLGQWLLSQATLVATESITSSFEIAKQSGNVAPDIRVKTPNLVKDALGDRHQRSPYVKLLRERLDAAA